MSEPFDVDAFMEQGRKRHIREAMLAEKKSIAERQTLSLDRIAARLDHLNRVIETMVARMPKRDDILIQKSDPVPFLLFGILVAMVVIAWKVVTL